MCPGRIQGADRSGESGNIIFIVLGAIILLGFLTAAIQMSSRPEGSNIDGETLTVRASQVRQYAVELEQAVAYIMRGGASEEDIRFAHPDAAAGYGAITDEPEHQVFDRRGGGATYREPPAGINDGSAWEFYGGTHLPDAGSDKAELIAVLPDVTKDFCDKINDMNGYDAQPEDKGSSATSSGTAGGCLQMGAAGRFSAAQKFFGTANTTDESTFSVKPSLEACVLCAADGKYHFYHVLMVR